MEDKDLRRQLCSPTIPNEEAIERRCACRITGPQVIDPSSQFIAGFVALANCTVVL